MPLYNVLQIHRYLEVHRVPVSPTIHSSLKGSKVSLGQCETVKFAPSRSLPNTTTTIPDKVRSESKLATSVTPDQSKAKVNFPIAQDDTMPYSNKPRDPLSPLSPNSAGKANATCKQKNRVIRQPYTALGPRIHHAGEPLLPWRNVSEVTGLRVFELFWDSEVIAVLVTGTNAYTKQKDAAERREGETGAGASLASGVCPWGRPWRKVTESEMRVFLAILIYMGTKRECGSSGYWRRGVGKDVFRAMSLVQFSQIKRYIHISDPKIQLSRAEWFKKLEPLNMMIQARCQKYYFPALNVTIDEMMIRFGGSSFHTYRMPSKPIKEGYKVFALCDVGYTYSWVFASRSDSFAGLVPQTDLTPTRSTVFQLACSLPYTFGYHFNIYMDNYFASQQLMIRLRALGIGACGTARVNGSAFPPDLQDERKTIP